MSGTPDNFGEKSCFSSPPCYAAEIAPDYFDPLGVDPQQALDVARWRKAERARLRQGRQNLSYPERQRANVALIKHLRTLLLERLGTLEGRVLAAYWAIKGEPSLQPWLTELAEGGVRIVLPVVETKAAPLVFRCWAQATRLVPGHWGIPVPPRDAQAMCPAIMLVPLLGWADGGYRLGYGGGYFDRTLATLMPRPFTIGVGFDAAQLPTIYPQPHDIPLDMIVTEAGLRYST